MSGCAIPKNLHVYNAGIALYGRAKMFDKAMEWFGRLKRGDPCACQASFWACSG